MERKRTAGVAAGIAGAALLGVGLWWRRHPSSCPYGLRLSLELPHPFLTRPRLREILAPKPGEKVLEVGPGTGYHALHVAQWLEPGGTLDILDVQREMLDNTMRRARELGISNVVPTHGDARELPYPDDTFDAAYLNFVLGEVPDQYAALRELRRVLKPGARLVVGEALPDPHMVKVEALRERAEAAGLRFERRLGRPFGYYARFLA
jgi:ubiquinone/menaquinone biosynthesis C-methylase UbiE